jgi:hypothetical protein
VTSRRLTLDDIADARAYERERDEFRSRVIALKRLRRVHLGPVVTMTFENRDTMRFQIQEMARAEKLYSDAEIQVELDAYNPLIPDVRQLCATLFVELTTDAELREWLPRLVGIERAPRFRLADGTLVDAVVDEQHASRLTRITVTAAVHYVRFDFTAGQVEVFGAGEVVLESTHPGYLESTPLASATVAELLHDLREGPAEAREVFTKRV